MKELPIWDPSSRIGFFKVRKQFIRRNSSSVVLCWLSLNPLFIKRFSQQIDALWSLKHEHIVEFIGYTAATGFEAVSLVTHHMGNGNLVDYVHEELDRSTRLELVSRVRFCNFRNPKSFAVPFAGFRVTGPRYHERFAIPAQ